MSLAILGCSIVENQRLVEKNVFVREGKIYEITPSSDISNKRDFDIIIDGRKKVLLPGVIDAHVHFRVPGGEHKEDWTTGSCAAASGGVTTVLDMPNTSPPTTTVDRLNEKRIIASNKSIIDFGFHFGAEFGNANEIEKARNIASIKIFMGSSTGNLLIDDDAELYSIFELAEKHDLLCTVHAENERLIKLFSDQAKFNGKTSPTIHPLIRNNLCAAEAVSKAELFSRFVGNRLHVCHVSTKEELDFIKLGKKLQREGRLSAEATMHHLLLSSAAMLKSGNYAKMNPPLRSKEDISALWSSLREGVIDIIASDHAPHTREEKDKPYWQAPAGVPGVETNLPLLLNEVNRKTLSFEDLINFTSKNPAKIYRIKNKGEMKRGYDADFALVDMDIEQILSSSNVKTKCGWTPFNGITVQGAVEKTIVRGKIVFDKGEFFLNKGKEVEFTRSTTSETE
ncbi:MAG: dihydroorotase [Candidatus Diapherotrites archaeon]|nr:dihydroorotase [Candidatus Diapherotrites archaeon]